MKLIFCQNCWDVFKLTTGATRRCECGQCVGRYDDNGETAVTNGKGVNLAVGNGSLVRAIAKHAGSTDVGDRTSAIQEFGFLAWVRDPLGPQNPHTRVDPELQ